jgi:RNA recognition motif-containing protein
MDMEVFIGNLAENVTVSDLTVFFRAFANKVRIRIVEKRQEDRTRVRYAVADFDSDKLAIKAIKKLNQKDLRGRPVVMREYFHRSYNNERRALNWRDKPWNGPERRQVERRKKESSKPKDDFEELLKRSEQEAEENTGKVQISGYAHLARKG